MASGDKAPQQGRANLWLLTAAQALGASSPPIIISLGGLVGRNLSDNGALATLPVSLYQAGVALSVIPAAFLMRALGRRHAYLLAAVFGVLSGLIAAFGIIHGSFLTFCLGTLVAGFYGAHVQSYRFAATDNMSEPQRNRAISWIMVGGLIAAIIGPQLVIWTRSSYGGIEFAGSFFSQSMLALLAMLVLFFYRPLISPKTNLNTKIKPPANEADFRQTDKPSIGAILRLPGFWLAAITGAVSYALMSFLMTATPMAMHDHNHSIDHATLGIQWHILAMFAPSFFTGRLMNKFGLGRITALGLILIMLAAATALTGYSLMSFYTALILLGLGWNFSFIGATAMIAALSTPQNKTKIQGVNDFIVFGSVALSSFLSGALLQSAGWTMINLAVFPIVMAVLVPLIWRKGREGK